MPTESTLSQLSAPNLSLDAGDGATYRYRRFGTANARAAWVALRLFVEINGWSWSERPSIDEAEQAVLAIAAGEWDEDRAAQWLREKLVHEPAS